MPPQPGGSLQVPLQGARKHRLTDPKRELFKKTTLCRHYAARKCDRGDACPFAHGQEEMRSKPDLRKTALCNMFARGRCQYASWECPWAHGEKELQKVRKNPYLGVGYNNEFPGGNYGKLSEARADAGREPADFHRQEIEQPPVEKNDDIWDIQTDDGEDFESERSLPLLQEGSKPSSKEAAGHCPRCRAGSHVQNARFCTRCGFALGGSGSPLPLEDGSSAMATMTPYTLGCNMAMTPPVDTSTSTMVVLVPASMQGWTMASPMACAGGDSHLMTFGAAY